MLDKSAHSVDCDKCSFNTFLDMELHAFIGGRSWTCQVDEIAQKELSICKYQSMGVSKCQHRALALKDWYQYGRVHFGRFEEGGESILPCFQLSRPLSCVCQSLLQRFRMDGIHVVADSTYDAGQSVGVDQSCSKISKYSALKLVRQDEHT